MYIFFFSLIDCPLFLCPMWRKCNHNNRLHVFNQVLFHCFGVRLMIDAPIKREEEAICTQWNNIQETKVCWIVPKLFTTDSLWGKKKTTKKPHGKAKASLSILSDSQLTRSSFMSFSGLSFSCLSCSIWPLKWSSDVSTVKERCCLKCAIRWILHTRGWQQATCTVEARVYLWTCVWHAQTVL